MTQAAIYCRSSKDRAEVGLPAQRAELRTFAKARGFTVAEEYSDMEVSGKRDETSRPGLRKLLTALADPARKWQVILALDTSRIARDPMLGLYVTREAEKYGAAIHYAKMPVDGSSAFGETMLSVVRAFDRLHSRLSAEKGRGGSEANIASGFRAGGAAPFGYKLQHKETGGTRGGMAVRKSTLVLDRTAAEKVKAFLRARAEGVTRHVAARRARLQDKAVASLIGIERNALTYAGFTVWNQRQKMQPTREDPRKTMRWRPRGEWIISDKPTHAALITREQAERILAAADVSNPKAKSARVRAPDKFLLSGLLFTPEGVQWHGDAHDSAYRAGAKGRRVNAPFIEGEILYRVAADFADRSFLKRTIAEARRMAAGIEANPAALDPEIRRTEKRIATLLDMASDGDRSVLERIRALEATLGTLREQRASWGERKALKAKLEAVNEADLRRILAATAVKLRGDVDPATGRLGPTSAIVLDWIGYRDDERMKPDELRHILATLVNRIELDPNTRQFTIRYRLPVTGVKVASPRGFEPRLPP